MHTLIGLLVVVAVGAALATGASEAFIKGMPVLGIGLAFAVSIGIGYLMASPFFLWRAADGTIKPRLGFPGVVAILSVASGFFGLGPVLGWAYSMSFVPAHAALSGWLFGIVGSTVVVALGVRFGDYLVTRRSAARPMEEEFVIAEPARGSAADPSWEVHAMRAAGVILLLMLMVVQLFVGPMIFRRFGPDASYETAIGSVTRSVAILAPLATIAGFTLERVTRGRDTRQRSISILLMVLALAAIGEASYRYIQARDSDNGRWWIEHR